MIKPFWTRRPKHNQTTTDLASSKNSDKIVPLTKPRLKTLTLDFDRAVQVYPHDSHRARLELYRYLRDQLPVLNAVIWTWVRLCAARYEFQIIGARSAAEEESIRSLLYALDQRVYRNGLLKRGGFRELLMQFFESLFTDGAVCGELQLSPSRRQVDRFLLADMKTILIEPDGEHYRLFQEDDNKRTQLNNDTVFYYGLGAQPGSIEGRSLLSAVPFVARVEQTLVSDMHRAMRSAGYHRIHVKINRPDKRSDETDGDYFTRANNYFDDTVDMMRDFGPDKNPVTWDDVNIEYIGPGTRSTSTSGWYLNHKAMIEDICSGTHLAPFMLGYAYGTTHNWAEFKYELVQRQVVTVQNAAAALLNWIANVELALNGFAAEVQYRFENRAHIGLTERAQAEKIQIDNIVTKLTNKLITHEEAVSQIARIA